MKQKSREMIVESIRIHAATAQRVVVLKEKDGVRSLFIWIGPNEAESIYIGLKHIGIPRPFTHDLFLRVLEKIEAKVIFVDITDIAADTFFARLNIHLKNKTIGLDARPSDAIALAVRSHAPIFVANHVLEKAGVIEKETGFDERTENLGPFSNILEALGEEDVDDKDIDEE